MNDHNDADSHLLALLGQALGPDEEVPEELQQAAIDLFALHDFDAELLSLLTDSAYGIDTQLMRSTELTWRVLSFRSGSIEVELELDSHGQRTLTGRIESDVDAQVEVLGTSSAVAVDVDAHGRFMLSPVPDGPFRVLTTGADGSRHITPVLDI